MAESYAYGSESTVETVETVEEIVQATSKETKTFTIVGVIDPRDDETISIYRAICEGIISQRQGLYINPDTQESMPIPDAMNKGLILVEFTDAANTDEEVLDVENCF